MAILIISMAGDLQLLYDLYLIAKESYQVGLQIASILQPVLAEVHTAFSAIKTHGRQENIEWSYDKDHKNAITVESNKKTILKSQKTTLVVKA